jgi:hypothetical protein
VVDNTEIPNTIREVDIIDREQAVARSRAKNQRRVKFYKAHREAVVRRSVNSVDPGKRSKKGSGAQRLII